MLLAVAVIGSNSLSLGPIAPGIAVELGTSVERVLYGSASYGLGTGLAALLLARWIDRFGAVRVLRITFLLLFTALLGCALSPGIVLLVLTQLIAGIAAGVALPAVYAQAALMAPPGYESRILGRVLVGWTISMVGGVSLAAMLADLAGWRSVYLTIAGLALLVLYLFHRMLAVANESTMPVQGSIAPSPLNAFNVPGVPLLLLMVALYMMSFYASYGFVGDYVVHTLNYPLSANAWVVVAYGSGFGIAALFDAQIDRYNPILATPVTLLLLAAVYIALFISDSYQALVALAFVWGLMNHLALNVLIARLSAADPKQRGTVLGLYSGITYLCMSLATLIAGVFYAVSGWPVLNVVAACLCAVAALLAFPQAKLHWSTKEARQ